MCERSAPRVELAVRAAITSQKNNSQGAWRYSPDSTDADTSVSGAVLVGLLAARNAGIEIPDQSIDKAISFYRQMTSSSGQVAYAGLGGFDESLARVSIATLVYSVARRKDLAEYKATLGFLKDRVDGRPTRGAATKTTPATTRPRPCSRETSSPGTSGTSCSVRKLKQAQQRDGSIEGQFGVSTSTSLSLLAVAVNFRFLPIYER